jgi:hypothetical protein
MQYFMAVFAVQILKTSIVVGAALHVTDAMLSCAAQIVSS